MNSDVPESEDEAIDTKLSAALEQADDNHSALSSLLDFLEQEIEPHSNATAILKDVRHLHQQIGVNLMDIDERLGEIERSDSSA